MFEEELIQAKNGEVRNMITVALCFANGTGTDKNLCLSEQWLKKVEDSDDLNALINLGELYQQGHLLDKNMEKAKYLFEKVREENILAGSYMLGKYYLGLDNSSHSLRSAAMSFKEAADYGHVLSRIRYSYLSRQGVLGVLPAIKAYIYLPALLAFIVLSIYSKDRGLRYWYYEDMFHGGKIAEELHKRMGLN